MNGESEGLSLFFSYFGFSISTHPSPPSVKPRVMGPKLTEHVCVCVFPNSWAGPIEPKPHGWLLITHPNNPHIT